MNNKEKIYNFPNDPYSLEVFKELEDPNYEMINQRLPFDASEVEKMKYKFCKDILSFQIDHKISDEDIAKKLNISIEKVLEILYCHINKFNLEDLINYAEKLAESYQSKLIVNHSNNFVTNHNYYASSRSSNKNYIL